LGDIAAAYARSRLKDIDKDNVKASQNWNQLNNGLKDIPGLIQPIETRIQKNNGYAYVFRVDPETVPAGTTLATWRDAIAEVLAAEGVPVSPARMSLPAHTVIQAKQGYGHGCPWSCPHTRKNISYAMSQYPVTNKTVDSSIQIAINGHRPPNGSRQIRAIIQGIRKVFEHLDLVPVKK
jgi:dTDP-4-amino-4,6-dideoxygalactose transaminase